jgi:hypothetical protein
MSAEIIPPAGFALGKNGEAICIIGETKTNLPAEHRILKADLKRIGEEARLAILGQKRELLIIEPLSQDEETLLREASVVLLAQTKGPILATVRNVELLKPT